MLKDCPFTKRLREHAICIDMHHAADVIDAMAKVNADDEALMKRALRSLELYQEQTRPIWEVQEVVSALTERLKAAKAV